MRCSTGRGLVLGAALGLGFAGLAVAGPVNLGNPSARKILVQVDEDSTNYAAIGADFGDPVEAQFTSNGSIATITVPGATLAGFQLADISGSLVPIFCTEGPGCQLVPGAPYDPTTGQLNAVGDIATLFFDAFTPFGDLELSEVVSCDVTMSQASYGDGQPVVITSLRYSNASASPTPTRLRLQLQLPFGVTFNAVDAGAGGGVALPEDFDRQLGPITMFTLQPGHPRGSYAWRCALEDPVTGAVQAEDVATFEFRTGAGLPTGFREVPVFTNLSNPTALRFSPDGRVFVAEKGGRVKVFSGLSDPTPDVLLDLSVNVQGYWDRGLLGLALDPGFPTIPYIYVLYTRDALPGGIAPLWGDTCPTPPGPMTDGCTVTGRLSRFLVTPTNTVIGNESVLLQDQWCQQFPSHTIGDLRFGPDGALYVSAGDGASFAGADYGQLGGTRLDPNTGLPVTPQNPCGDPTNEGGALRSQDVLSAGDPVGLGGSILRINPDGGEAFAGNPLVGVGPTDDDSIIAHGFRNPFRFAIRPGTSELWIGDVGWNAWEEIDRIVDPSDANVENFGWPCYEGSEAQPGYEAIGLPLCSMLYSDALPTWDAKVLPFYTWNHASSPPGCGSGGTSSITGLAFSGAGNYPARYAGALFFADYSRNCIWAMLTEPPTPETPAPLPDPARIEGFAVGATAPVSLEIGPDGNLYYANLNGDIRRIEYFAAGNQPPVAVLRANPTSGSAPLAVAFDGSASSDPDDGIQTYAWDFDNDGTTDATGPTAGFPYTTPGLTTVALTVTDHAGASSTARSTISVDNSAAPVATITSPPSTLPWSVGDTIDFSGGATDAEDGTLPASALDWELIVQHCATFMDCHAHQVEHASGVDHGSFVAPDHEYPSYLELRLTAQDSGGLVHTQNVKILPRTITQHFRSSPTGLRLVVGSNSIVTPFDRLTIPGSSVSISAPSPQLLDDSPYSFTGWSDGGAGSHEVTAGSVDETFTATFAASPE